MVSLGMIGTAYFPFTLGAQFSGFQVDGALYVLMAEYFSPFVPADPLLDYVRQGLVEPDEALTVAASAERLRKAIRELDASQAATDAGP